MPLLNYSTRVGAARTVGEIQRILVAHGAKSFLIEYGDDEQLEAVAFEVPTAHGKLGIRLPVDPDATLRVLQRQHSQGKLRARSVVIDRPQAVRVAWRIVKDWVEAQVAIIETEMVRLEQVFLPYAVTRNGQTVYELFEQGQFKMLERGEGHEDL